MRIFITGASGWIGSKVTDELLADALRALHAKQGGVKFLGSYPIAGAAPHHDGESHDARWLAAEQWVASLQAHISQ